jgi:heme/copper-type cytochrome/quinol oxidase subunit 2
MPPQDPGTSSGQWALLNLILAVVAIIFAFALIIHLFTGRRKDENSYGNTTKGSNGNIWRALVVIAGIASPIVFLLTEDMTLPMSIVDMWTLLMAAIVVVQVVLTLVMWQVRKPGQDDSDGEVSSTA